MKKVLFILALLALAPVLHAQTINVDLTWEADSYAPAEYLGKPLATTGNKVKVMALTSIPASSLEFWWRLDDYDLPDYSGLGRNSFVFDVTGQSGSVHTVQLVVKSGGQNILSKTLSIPIAPPQLIFYEQDPILGEIFNKSFTGSYELPKSEITFVAEPFFFNRADANKLDYTWTLNGQKVAADNAGGRVITFTTPSGGGKGTNAIKLLAENPNNALQYIENSFSVIFNSNSYDNNNAAF